MNKLNFNQTGGFPLSTNILDAMQEAYSVFNSLGHLAGQYAIISGCNESGNNISDGVIFINGEILPFKGGSKSATIFIKEESESRVFEDGATKPVIFKRYASFGSSTPDKTYQWAEFKRIKNLAELEVEKATTTALAGAITELNKIIASAKSEIQNKIDEAKGLINSHIGNTNNPHNITPEQVGILRVGSVSIGDIPGQRVGYQPHTGAGYTVTVISKEGDNDALYKVEFTEHLPTSAYIVIGSFKSYKNWNDDNDLTYVIVNTRRNGFDIGIRELARNIQNVNFEFVIIKK